MSKNQRGYDRDKALETEQPRDNVIGGDFALRSLLSSELDACQRAIKYFALDWDEYEDILFVQSRSPDNLHVRISEGTLSSIVVERAARNMAQMPSGVVNALGIKNTGCSLLMNLLLHNWVYPNANEQYDLETKLFLWDMYSNVYGTFPMMYDWTFRDNYKGPDCWLVPIRNFFPQQGRFSTNNSDYMYVSTFMGRDDLEDLVENNVEGYDLECINGILHKTKGKAVAPRSENDYLRHNPMFQYRRRSQFTDTGQFEIVTKYEAGANGRWISFFADYEAKVMRNIENPHEDGRIPVALKYALPTLDSIIGLGAMEKGRFMQYGLDTVLNLQLDYQKIHTYPPIKVIMQNVLMPSIRFQPAAKWGVSSMDDIGHHVLPEADQSHNLTYQFLKGALNNVNGNSQTPVNTSDQKAMTQGKTKQAIKERQQSESTIDALDLKFMQKAIEELFGGFISMINSKAKDSDDSDPIELDMFDDEIKQLIGQGYDDIKDIVQWAGKVKGVPIEKAASVYLKIKQSRVYNERGYKYRIDANTTLAEEQEDQHEELNEIMTTYIENPTAIETMLNAGGSTVDFPELFKQWLITGGLRQWNRILKPMAQGTPAGQQGATGGPGGQQAAQQAQKGPGESINFKDMPPSGQIQMAGQAGIQLAPQDVMPQPSQGVSQIDPSLATGSIITQPVNPIAAAAQSQPPTELPAHDPSYMIQHPEIRQAYASVRSRMGAQ